MSKSVLPMFSSKSLIVSGLTFRSLIHFEFVFRYGVRECSNFILLPGAVQFSQHHLLKRLSFLHCIFLPPLSKIRWPYGQHRSLIVSIVSPFPESHVVGIMQCIAFPDWLLSLSNMHLRFHCAVPCLDMLFLFSTKIILHCLDVPQFIYSFTYGRTSWLLSSGHKISTPLDKYQEVWLLDCMVRVC